VVGSNYFNEWPLLVTHGMKQLQASLLAACCIKLFRYLNVISRAVPNILFVFYSVRIIGRIMYSYSAE